MTRHGSMGMSEEQAELLDLATKYCADKSGIDTVRRLLEDDRGYDPGVYGEIAELGWFGIAIPEAHGGAGLELAEVVPVVEQMGRNLMAGPFVPTTLAAQVLLTGGTAAQQSEVLPQLAAGTAAAVACMEAHADWEPEHIECEAERRGASLSLRGTKTFVVDAAAAQWIVVSVKLEGAPALVLLDRSAIDACELRRETVIDETRRSFQLRLDGVSVSEGALLDPARAGAALARVELVGSLLAAAEMSGGGAGCVNYTIRYLNDRKQFGRQIGSYQALKHPLVEAHVGIEKLRSHVYSAAHTFENEGGEVATRMAKAHGGAAFAFAADRAIQFHGGFGFTYECDAQLYRRRSLWCENQHGDSMYHRRKLADLIL